MISLEKWMILTPSQKLTKNVGDLGKIIVVKCFEWLPKVQKSPNLVTLWLWSTSTYIVMVEGCLCQQVARDIHKRTFGISLR